MASKPKYLLQIKQNYSLETENCTLDRKFSFISSHEFASYRTKKITSYRAKNLSHIARLLQIVDYYRITRKIRFILQEKCVQIEHFPSDSGFRFIHTENSLHIALKIRFNLKNQLQKRIFNSKDYFYSSIALRILFKSTIWLHIASFRLITH